MKNLSIILPLPEEVTRLPWQRLMPPEIYPDGMKMLAVLALQNSESFDDFFSDAYILLEVGVYGEDVDNAVFDRHRRRIVRQSFLEVLDIFLHTFFHDFLERVRPILDPKLYGVERVVSYRASRGVCVELSNEPTPRLSYCPAR